ncbi:MAG: ABC transporter substrate-binding protein [Bacillota bacterium]
MRRWIWWLLTALLVAGCSASGPGSSDGTGEPAAIRLGYMANLTHAQAVLGVAESTFEQTVGVPVIPRLFAAGPAAIQALFAGEIDLLYIGPSPAITGYLRSDGSALRIIAGAASGGAVFVVRDGVDPADLRGARLATPGLANTQDIALRHLLARRGWRTRERGGDVTLSPMAPAEILSLFARGQLDGAWVAEPWGSRLIQEAGARLVYDERELWPDRVAATTVLAARPEFLKVHRDEAKRFLEAHLAITRWIQTQPDQARVRLQAALADLQGRPLPDRLMAEAFGRIDFRSDPMTASVEEQAQRAYQLGLLGARKPDLSGLFDLSLLEEVVP